jgi:hypothetical protein
LYCKCEACNLRKRKLKLVILTCLRGNTPIKSPYASAQHTETQANDENLGDYSTATAYIYGVMVLSLGVLLCRQ